MKRVLIVEDDKFFRFAMKKTIRWEENGLALAGEAVHGGVALEFLEREPVNIVLTDMNMPIMNGVQLTARIRERYPYIMVIALSAYDDFELVKEAMKLGASDYLLKQDMEEQDIGKKIADNWKRHIRELSEKSYVHKGIEELLRGEPAAEVLWIPEFLRDCLEVEKGVYLCLIRGLREKWKDAGLNGSKWLDDSLLELNEGQERVLFFREPEAVSSRKKLEERSALLAELKERLKQEEYLGAVGSPFREIDRAETAWREVRERLQRAALTKERGILTPEEENGAGDSDWKYQPGERKKGVTLELAVEELHELTDTMRRVLPDAENVRQAFLVFLESVADDGNLNPGVLDYTEFSRGITKAVTLEEKQALTEVCLRQMFEQRKKDRYSPAVRQGIRFIETHYGESIALRDIAGSVAMNESYFSNLFKREVGMGVIDYLNSTRIANAKRLLEQSSLKNYEIGERVGIPNASYFSTLFRKETGMTIQEYRKQYK